MQLVGGKTTIGIKNIFGEEEVPKGTKFTEKLLGSLNYQNLDTAEWTKEEETNELIKRLIHNFNIKFNEEKGRFLRDKYAITVGDELPSGVLT